MYSPGWPVLDIGVESPLPRKGVRHGTLRYRPFRQLAWCSRFVNSYNVCPPMNSRIMDVGGMASISLGWRPTI